MFGYSIILEQLCYYCILFSVFLGIARMYTSDDPSNKTKLPAPLGWAEGPLNPSTGHNDDTYKKYLPPSIINVHNRICTLTNRIDVNAASYTSI